VIRLVRKRPVSEKELTVYKEKIKEIAQKKGFRISESFIAAFDRAVRELLEKAIKRGEIEGRKTLLPRHI